MSPWPRVTAHEASWVNKPMPKPPAVVVEARPKRSAKMVGATTEEATPSGQNKTTTAGFIVSLGRMLRSQDVPNISWSASGKYFVVEDFPSFERNVLPRFFKHSKMSSFQRQLNYFGFHKLTKKIFSVHNCAAFEHGLFTRDLDPASFHLIQRKGQKKIEDASTAHTLKGGPRILPAALKTMAATNGPPGPATPCHLPPLAETTSALRSQMQQNAHVASKIDVHELPKLSSISLHEWSFEDEKEQQWAAVEIEWLHKLATDFEFADSLHDAPIVDLGAVNDHAAYPEITF
ncbi:hypothetical protein ACHHYP_04622 [Achlya hypogyna]|uniref:HSF-type DNA-binding domain-containing protein n=1 Tax=Achlya hypogyna TaxID=1202772 RepID=A0A1V9ZP16_ACHHY|nr:hypothetical protein ACHHYP_04622 [Achlya hypogyna]